MGMMVMDRWLCPMAAHIILYKRPFSISSFLEPNLHSNWESKSLNMEIYNFLKMKHDIFSREIQAIK